MAAIGLIDKQVEITGAPRHLISAPSEVRLHIHQARLEVEPSFSMVASGQDYVVD
jgi:hypothetical protein